MTTEPYTPDEAELIGCYAGAMEEQAGENYATAKADAERGIEVIKAKARAEAWDEGQEAGWSEAEECCAVNGMVGDLHKHATTLNPHRIEGEA